ncbi:hypothetical protein KFL_001020080 [Klebsormidium nitens]|uniref:Uncharacterized protein n=1 Tax=Klebsormidium nitens TaxID=105231 RepID=A0A1Y1I051_KLENI|nr:hypothetical protein KFL_001020080 [Klebsormidium nitens]|eukprot:GAQ82157.1 hypothetical protein KFL_001020080 [Klebsormidium nitens]
MIRRRLWRNIRRPCPQAPIRTTAQETCSYSKGNCGGADGGNDTANWSYPFNRLFKPLGARSFSLGTDGVGTFLASPSFFATAHDWARLGKLYLQDGVWNGTRILPPGCVNYTRTSSEASADFDCGPASRAIGNCGPYGALWWLRPFRNVASDRL